MISPVRTQQFILLFPNICFDQKGNHWVEWNIKRIYIYTILYGIDISLFE